MALVKNSTKPVYVDTRINFHPVKSINQKIEQIKENAFGIYALLITLNTMVASFSVALSVHEKVSFFFLIISLFLATSVNIAIISQRSLKTIVWTFIFSVLINTFLAIFQFFIG